MSPDNENPELPQAATPATPIAPWFGGKKYLARRIIERVEELKHRCYAEPFSGMGGVLLRRATRSKTEILNDINGDIVNLFRVVREHPQELHRQFDWTVASRVEFRRLLEVPPATLTDVQRAARFAYLQRLRFAGVATGTGMNFSAYHPARVTPEKMRRLIEGVHERLQGVIVENLDWATFIARYDKPFTVFYIDPPYWGHETDYGRGIFGRDAFARMADILRGLKGRFILSLNDRPEVRETFAGFAFEEVETRYSANAKATRRVGELLISGGGNGT